MYFSIDFLAQQFSVGTCKSAAPFGNIRGICEVAQQRHLAWLILPQREVKSKTMCFGRIGTFFRRCLGWIELPGSCQLKYSAGSLSPRWPKRALQTVKQLHAGAANWSLPPVDEWKRIRTIYLSFAPDKTWSYLLSNPSINQYSW